MRAFYQTAFFVSALIAIVVFLIAVTTDLVVGYAGAVLWSCIAGILFLELLEDVDL